MNSNHYREYGYGDAGVGHMHSLLVPCIFSLAGDLKVGSRVLNVGCGNGFLCGQFIDRGLKAVGVDLSEQGISLARQAHPQGRFEVVGIDSDLPAKLGEPPFDLVVSTEVVEHLYDPRAWAKVCLNALNPGGILICSTPYHGYLKNLALSITGHWDVHANPLWDGGHIKLWSRKTLTALLTEVGFANITIHGVGRVPGLWMTMIAKAERLR